MQVLKFDCSSNRQINLFIAGYGNVGKALIAMIERQRNYLSQTIATDLSIVGICNSSKMVFDTAGLTKKEIDKALVKDGNCNYSPQLFIEKISQLSLNRSIFVDCTSDLQLSMLYKRILSDKIGIVTCNKIANTLDMQYYRALRAAARRECVPFLYETNAGAALPVISLLKQIVRSGDTIRRIEATLSGSLNYLFNTYNGTNSFASIVRFEQEAGYTEPDPRTDLKGTDVLRKALILAREQGMEMEAEDIKVASFLPKECMDGGVDQFFASLEKNEPYFKLLYENALKDGKKLSYSILIEDGRAEIGLKSITPDHPFYPLRSTDNAIIVTTDFYPEGIRVSGAGAGGQQTASGILNDILTT